MLESSELTVTGVVVGSFYLTETVSTTTGQTWTADDLTGSYTSTNSRARRPRRRRATVTTEGIASYIETATDDSSTQETGNSITGAYTQTLSGGTITNDADTGSNAVGSFSVTETSNESYSDAIQTGNSISGDYTLSKSVAGTYSVMEENDESVNTLSETGSISYIDSDSGEHAVGGV